MQWNIEFLRNEPVTVNDWWLKHDAINNATFNILVCHFQPLNEIDC